MRSFCFAWILLVAFNPPHLSAQESRVSPEPLWTWFGNCSNKKHMGLEVLMNGTVIHRSSFPICRINYRYQEVDARQKIVVFFFKGGYVFQGQYHTVRTQTIEGNIWQAGADLDAIILGVSFSSPTHILLNTIHLAKLGGESKSLIDRGLIVRTFPIRRK
jgi:hypothetical protein